MPAFCGTTRFAQSGVTPRPVDGDGLSRREAGAAVRCSYSAQLAFSFRVDPVLALATHAAHSPVLPREHGSTNMGFRSSGTSCNELQEAAMAATRGSTLYASDAQKGVLWTRPQRFPLQIEWAGQGSNLRPWD